MKNDPNRVLEYEEVCALARGLSHAAARALLGLPCVGAIWTAVPRDAAQAEAVGELLALGLIEWPGSRVYRLSPAGRQFQEHITLAAEFYLRATRLCADSTAASDAALLVERLRLAPLTPDTPTT